MLTIDKYLSLNFFLTVNVLIIALTETLGGGTLFFRTGIIHIIAISFVGLALIRVFFHYYTYDHILEKFIHASLAAMAIFATSHIIEFFSFVVLHRYADAIYVNVANSYLISLLLIATGAESFLRVLHGRTVYLVRTLIAAIVDLGLYIASMLAKKIGVLLSFESEENKGTTFYVHVPDASSA